MRIIVPIIVLAWLIQGGVIPGYGQSTNTQSEWAKLDATGKLTYKTMTTGDRILDFSHAGYKGGGVKLPVVPVRKMVEPSGGDDSEAIQVAIDAVATLPLLDGFRGAVLLGPGTFHCANPITLSKDGIVLRGSGADKSGTIIEMTDSPHTCLNINGKGLKYPQDDPASTFPITIPMCHRAR